MLFTTFMSHRQLRRQLQRWNVWCLAWLIISCAALAWAQIPTPGPPLPPLFGAQVEGVTATSDTVVDVTLESGSSLSGKIVDANGMEVFAATVLAQSETEVFAGAVLFDFDPANPTLPQFKYRMVLPDGTYHLFVRMIVIDLTVTPSQLLSTIIFDLQETVIVAGATERDLVVPAPPPFATLSGQVASLGTLPSHGGLLFQSEDGRVSNVAQAEMVEGAIHATYRVTLPVGTYHVFFLATLPESLTPDVDNPMPPPPPDPEVPQQFVFTPVGTVAVSADQVFDINVPAVVPLTGKLQDSLGMALAGAGIFAASGLPQEPPPPPPSPARALCQEGALTAPPLAAASSTSLLEGNTLGDYELLVVPGDYQVGVTASVALVPPATVPPGTLEPQQGFLTFPFPFEVMTIVEPQVRNFMLPVLPEVVLISGRVTDQQSQPVSGARVDAVSSMVTATPAVSFTNGVETNELGAYQLLALSGVNYTLLVCPPAPNSSMTPATP